MNDFDTVLLFSILGISSIVIFALTLMNKVTFFYDTKDFVCSFSQVFIITALILIYAEGYQSFFELFFYQQAIVCILLLIALGGLFYCIRYSLLSSIQANGRWLGILIYFFKILFGTILSFSIIAKFRDLIDVKNSTFATRTAAFVFLGLFSWMLSVMINGEAAKLKKELSSDG